MKGCLKVILKSVVHIMWGRHGQHAAVVGQPVQRAHASLAESVHLAKLAQIEEQGELSGHGPESQEGSQDLGKQEEEVEGVDGSLQRKDDNSFIGQEEQQYWQLEHERQQPEGCQLWHLMTGERETGKVWVGVWRRCKDRAVSLGCIHIKAQTQQRIHTHSNLNGQSQPRTDCLHTQAEYLSSASSAVLFGRLAHERTWRGSPERTVVWITFSLRLPM